MHYYCRSGMKISKERWEALARDPHYCVLLEHRSGRVWVQTSWLGVAAEFEDVPGIYVTTARREGKDEKWTDLGEPTWSPNLRQAREAHARAVQQVLGGE